MSFVAFVPSLTGHRQSDRLSGYFHDLSMNTNASAAAEAARIFRLPFEILAYQTKKDPFPTLYEMGRKVGDGLIKLTETHGSPGLVVASSVGAGVLVNALEINQVSPMHILLLKGVYDPLSAIPLQAQAIQGGTNLLKAVEEGDGFFPLPVETSGNNEDPGIFKITRHHLVDENALRVFGQGQTERFKNNVIPRIETALIVALDQDPLSPPKAAYAFSQAIGGKSQVEIWKGDHQASTADHIKQRIQTHLNELGF